jgi:hypothetical protein
MATVTDTWYRISRPGKQDKVAKAGSKDVREAQGDHSPGRPRVAKVISPGVYPQARVEAAGLPDSAWTSDKTKPKAAKEKAAAKAADKAQAQGDDKAGGGDGKEG